LTFIAGAWEEFIAVMNVKGSSEEELRVAGRQQAQNTKIPACHILFLFLGWRPGFEVKAQAWRMPAQQLKELEPSLLGHQSDNSNQGLMKSGSIFLNFDVLVFVFQETVDQTLFQRFLVGREGLCPVPFLEGLYYARREAYRFSKS
jgi:hypothetical protein